MCACSEMQRMEKANESAVCQRSFDDFKVVCPIGKGTYGQVYKAVDTATRQSFA